ncbi:MAG: DUF222 domain-containing protein, partial [Mycobacteriales bacterium]|nr:HNH endonuclease [Frankia sp.]
MNDPTQLRNDELADSICTLAGRIAAATCEWLLLIAEFDRREAWGGPGLRSCAHWLNWRCGVSPRTAQEHVRVAHALLALPKIRKEFAAGRISYSKVRAITRVATPEEEPELLDAAQCATAGQIEDIVRGWRRCDALQLGHERYKRRRAAFTSDDDGTERMVLHLPPEEMAVVRAATQAMLAQIASADPTRDRDAENEAVMPQPSREATLADAVVAVFASWQAESRVVQPGQAASEAIVTVDLDTLRGTTPPPRTTRDIARIPAPPGFHRPRRPTRPQQVCRAGRRTAIAAETARRVLCDTPTVAVVADSAGNPFDLGRRTRRLNASLRRALWHRDGGRCQAPGCQRRGYLHAHHIRPWAKGGGTKLENLILLCPFHHELIHEGGWSIAVPAPHEFIFYDAEQQPVEYAHPQPTATAALEGDNRVDALEARDGRPADISFVLAVLLG